MSLRRAVSGLAVVAGLLLGVNACGGSDQARNEQTALPTVETPTTSSPTPTVTPKPVDPTVAIKAKVLADYQHFVSVQARGWVSNSPSYPYEEVMTGEALSSMKAVVTGFYTMGRKYSGSAKFVKGSVFSLNLKAKPATAIVHACVYDGLVVKSKTGKVISPPPAYVSQEDTMTLVAGRWKASDPKSIEEEAGRCPS